MLARQRPPAQAPSTQVAPTASPTARTQGSAGAVKPGIPVAEQPQDELATLLAGAVLSRHESRIADPDASGTVLARRAEEGPVELAVRMLELPASAPGPPSEDPLMAKAKAKGLRGLWEMRLAVVWGGVAAERSGAWSWRSGSPGERIRVLERSPGIARGSVSAAERPRFDAAVAAARAHILDEGVAQKLDWRETEKVYETPDIALEAMRAAVAGGLDTLKVLRPIATNATRFTPEHAELWRQLAADPKYKDNAFIQRYAKQGVPQFIYVLKGALSAIDLALKVTDDMKRATLLHAIGSEYDVSFRGGVHDIQALRDSMVLVFLDLANPDLHVPKHIKAPFVAVKSRLSDAKTPRQTLAAALTFLNAVRDLFRQFQRTVARSLLELDRDYKEAPWDWRDPLELLRGLHDDRRVKAQAAEGEAPPAPVSLDVEPGPVTVSK